MRSIRAIFIKQIKDMLKNFSVLFMFILFPLVAFVMTELVGGKIENMPAGVMTEHAVGQMEGMPPSFFTTMMASIFIGMSLIMSSSAVIAEDRENKSLRFLVIAGVKPHSYLLGIGGVIFIASLFTSVAFGFIGRFNQSEFISFMIIMLSGSIASILLGAIVGILSNNQQAATGLSMPLAMILGFGPMVATFNEQIASVIRFFYTYQINVIVNDFSAGIKEPLLVIWINIAVLAVLFIIAYKKKGLRN